MTEEPKPQADRFRKLECDEDEGPFEDKMRKVATPPKPEPEK